MIFMYNAGDMLIYPGTGVCRVDGIKNMALTPDGNKDYYVLKPVYDNLGTTIYMPTDHVRNDIRSVLSESEIYSLIHSVNFDTPLWVESDTERNAVFGEIIRGADRSKLIRLIAELHIKENEKTAAGKKLRSADKRALDEAEKLIHQEFAWALHLKPDDVADFVMREMNIPLPAEKQPVSDIA